MLFTVPFPFIVTVVKIRSDLITSGIRKLFEGAGQSWNVWAGLGPPTVEAYSFNSKMGKTTENCECLNCPHDGPQYVNCSKNSMSRMKTTKHAEEISRARFRGLAGHFCPVGQGSRKIVITWSAGFRVTYSSSSFCKSLDILAFLLTDRDFPRPIQCARIQPEPSEFSLRSTDSIQQFHKNFTAETWSNRSVQSSLLNGVSDWLRKHANNRSIHISGIYRMYRVTILQKRFLHKVLWLRNQSSDYPIQYNSIRWNVLEKIRAEYRCQVVTYLPPGEVWDSEWVPCRLPLLVSCFPHRFLAKVSW